MKRKAAQFGFFALPCLILSTMDRDVSKEFSINPYPFLVQLAITPEHEQHVERQYNDYLRRGINDTNLKFLRALPSSIQAEIEKDVQVILSAINRLKSDIVRQG
jgi:hypothetical protein